MPAVVLAGLALGLCVVARADPSPEDDKDKVRIGDHLFRNRKGELFFGTEKYMWNPERGPMPRRTYVDRVCLLERRYREVSLKRVVDVAAFRRVNAGGDFFTDGRRVFGWSMRPTGCPFYSLPRGRGRFLGANKDFLLYGDELYFGGILLDNEPKLDLSKLRVIELRSRKGRVRDFVTDGKVVFGAFFALDRSRVEDDNDLRDRDKAMLIRRFKLR